MYDLLQVSSLCKGVGYLKFVVGWKNIKRGGDDDSYQLNAAKTAVVARTNQSAPRQSSRPA
jgi:hypothetical protein